MPNEGGLERALAEERGDSIGQLLGQIKGKLMAGTYDVLNNHHEDVLELTSGQLRFEHRLTRGEAEQLERAVWSAGEDQTVDRLLKNVRDGLQQAGFNLDGHDLDITVRLREVPLDS